MVQFYVTKYLSKINLCSFKFTVAKITMYLMTLHQVAVTVSSNFSLKLKRMNEKK